MSVLKLNLGNCQNCYKCIRNCPIKAIAFKDGHVTVIEEECVLCGTCVEVCPQNARFIKNDVENVKELIRGKKPVYVSIAPSWQGYFEGVKFEALSAALKKLGFAGVEETAIGANEASREYMELLENGQMKNIIVTACASVVMMVERHYPDLIKCLAPVSSPMMAHAKLMRELYGDIKVVFIGPCLSKMNECDDPLSGGMVNYALTFADVERWLGGEQVEIGEEDSEAVGVKNPISRLYPKPTGILKTIPNDKYGHYKHLAVDGIERCMNLFEWMQREDIRGLFVEANLCTGGCIGGPIMRMEGKSAFLAELELDDAPKPYDAHPAKTSQVEFHHARVFANRATKNPMPTEEEIRAILAKIGKTSVEQELNCGSCGYSTCREKAIAVYQGKADINMCLPFFRSRAENLSNTIMSHSPNGIVALDEDMLVLDVNPTAEEILETTNAEAKGYPLPQYYGDDCFDEARRTERPVIKTGNFLREDRIVEQTVTYIAEHKMYVVFLKDVTDKQKDKEKMEKLRLSTIEIAQKVIDKQMVVAQEIAGLLGETTAETKVALTNLKKTMNESVEE